MDRGENMDIRFEIQVKIQRSVEEVFDAVHSPEKLSAYFATGGVSAPLHEGATVQWTFADNPGDEKFKFPVRVEKVIPNETIVLEWQGAKDHDTRVEFNFEQAGPEETLVKIAETGWNETQQDLDSSYGNCSGWTFMLAFLKAWAEHGINLREGGFGGLYKMEDILAAKKSA
jgi:uncharacterized protein YndB with AHSA1/START domain